MQNCPPCKDVLDCVQKGCVRVRREAKQREIREQVAMKINLYDGRRDEILGYLDEMLEAKL